MKKIIKLFAIMTLVLLLPMTVMADSGEIDNTPVDNVQQNSTVVSSNDLVKQSVDTNNIMNTTTVDLNGPSLDDVGNRIISKLYEVANLLQKAAVPIALAMFIVGGIMIVFGSLSKKGATNGIIVCILAVVSYIVCIYAPNIILSVSQWITG